VVEIWVSPYSSIPGRAGGGVEGLTQSPYSPFADWSDLIPHSFNVSVSEHGGGGLGVSGSLNLHL
jgi:hypothetical protein